MDNKLVEADLIGLDTVYAEPVNQDTCTHKWSLYTGLQEQWWYCTVCHIKGGSDEAPHVT